MDDTVHEKLKQCLNEDILYNHVYPYTMNMMPKNLMCDIRSFKNDINIIDSIYQTQYTSRTLHNDLSYFIYHYLNESEPNIPGYIILYRRLRGCCNKTKEELYEIHSSMFYHGFDEITLVNKNRTILSLMTPKERTHFIETFILIDDPINDEIDYY